MHSAFLHWYWPTSQLPRGGPKWRGGHFADSSSELSAQSLRPSHSAVPFMHAPYAQRNENLGHVTAMQLVAVSSEPSPQFAAPSQRSDELIHSPLSHCHCKFVQAESAWAFAPSEGRREFSLKISTCLDKKTPNITYRTMNKRRHTKHK